MSTQKKVWFVTGSQHLYGKKTLEMVAANSGEIAKYLDASLTSGVKVEFKPVLTTPDEIYNLCQQANNDTSCIGLICWMHTFSPAQMWINGLKMLNRPFVHLHTQHNQDIPWGSIDMDFMNLNQSAHGDREFGFICSRMRIERHVVVGHWKDPEVAKELDTWMRAAIGWDESKSLKIARFGDNMRDVAVTEGDKVEARLRFGWSIYGYGVGDLVRIVNGVSDAEAATLVKEYEDTYSISDIAKKDPATREKLLEAARIELGMGTFLSEGGFKAFTTTFEDLHGLKQLPGIAVQRLMAKGYGFGAEGDWKTSALVRCMKAMSTGLKGGTSFMEDYTYHLNPSGMSVLGAHMLEVCPSIAKSKPSLEVHPLSIGGKDDPPRLVFGVSEGEALNATVLDMGNRFRLLVNTVTSVEAPVLPKLPVARALWMPHPNLKVAASAWILAGGAHHTGFTHALKANHMELFAAMAGIEYLLIDGQTDLRNFKNEIRWNDTYFHTKR